jgi:hypothetical protein
MPGDACERRWLSGAFGSWRRDTERNIEARRVPFMARSTLCTMVAVAALLLVGVGTSTAAPSAKVGICHFQEDEGAWTKISVGGDAPAAHLANHDDAVPGGITSVTNTQLDADCQPVAGQSCGNCLATGHGTGCENSACQTAICQTESFCCDTSWDGVCASDALSTCLGGNVCTGQPACGNCVATGHGTGCEFPDCQLAVCAADSFCCTDAWDQVCVEEAFDACAFVGSNLCVAH